MACRLTIEATGQIVVAGQATRITVFGTASAGCGEVRVTAATSVSSSPIFQGVVSVVFPPQSSADPNDPANDGRFVAEFAAPGAGLACGWPLFVSVECVADSQCRKFAWRAVGCKSGGGAPGSGPGSDPGIGHGPDSDWPFPDPPHIVCPIWGRVFVNMLMPAMLMLVGGLSFRLPAVVGFALLLVAGAMAWYAFWSKWCAPPVCGVLRAWTWVLKRCTALAFSLAVLQMFLVPSVIAWFLVPALGVPVGWLVTDLRNRRCSIPASTDTVQQLQLW